MLRRNAIVAVVPGACWKHRAVKLVCRRSPALGAQGEVEGTAQLRCSRLVQLFRCGRMAVFATAVEHMLMPFGVKTSMLGFVMTGCALFALIFADELVETNVSLLTAIVAAKVLGEHQHVTDGRGIMLRTRGGTRVAEADLIYRCRGQYLFWCNHVRSSHQARPPGFGKAHPAVDLQEQQQHRARARALWQPGLRTPGCFSHTCGASWAHAASDEPVCPPPWPREVRASCHRRASADLHTFMYFNSRVAGSAARAVRPTRWPTCFGNESRCVCVRGFAEGVPVGSKA